MIDLEPLVVDQIKERSEFGRYELKNSQLLFFLLDEISWSFTRLDAKKNCSIGIIL